ncbi:hypothetical protein OAS45_02705 [Polaribacter sp.]|nr:hypothetical protein [Polaribacter sp.]MDC1374794.1 hypothetical protein [Polaribacter sp.]
MNHTKKTTVYTEAAFDLVLFLHESKWFILNDIQDPRPALELFSLVLSLKYQNTKLPIDGNLFSKKELNNVKELIKEYSK